MELNEIIKDICHREVKFGCYSAQIDGVSLYSLYRRYIRREVLDHSGMNVKDLKDRGQVQKKEMLVSIVDSLFHLLRLLFSPKKYSTVFFPFPRVEKINGVYLDKFTDPFIDVCGLNDDYIILERGRAGVHFKPRAHARKIVNIDFLTLYVRFYSYFFWRKHYRNYSSQYDALFLSIHKAFGLEITKEKMVRELYSELLIINIISRILIRISAERVIGPARDYQATSFISAHRVGIKAFEVQHGITYGETVMYSGYRDPIKEPDAFLAFGFNKPLDVYGIDEDKIVTIGWALNDYLSKQLSAEQYKETDVLVISDPEITDAIISITLILAESNPNSTFYVRTHPHETLKQSHILAISGKNNIKLQDKSINIAVVLQGFKHVIGENSTVLYEALAAGKKVGRLFYDGLFPKYLEESDRKCFWEIRNAQDFNVFLNEDVSCKESKSIYSKFNKELFLKTIGL